MRGRVRPHVAPPLGGVAFPSSYRRPPVPQFPHLGSHLRVSSAGGARGGPPGAAGAAGRARPTAAPRDRGPSSPPAAPAEPPRAAGNDPQPPPQSVMGHSGPHPQSSPYGWGAPGIGHPQCMPGTRVGPPRAWAPPSPRIGSPWAPLWDPQTSQRTPRLPQTPPILVHPRHLQTLTDTPRIKPLLRDPQVPLLSTPRSPRAPPIQGHPYGPLPLTGTPGPPPTTPTCRVPPCLPPPIGVPPAPCGATLGGSVGAAAPPPPTAGAAPLWGCPPTQPHRPGGTPAPERLGGRGGGGRGGSAGRVGLLGAAGGALGAGAHRG